MVNFYPHKAQFIIPGTTTIVDYVPVVSEPTKLLVDCNIQPIKATLETNDVGTRSEKKYKVFIPIGVDISELLKATKVEFNKGSLLVEPTTEIVTWDVLNVREKQLMAHEVEVGVNV